MLEHEYKDDIPVNLPQDNNDKKEPSDLCTEDNKTPTNSADVKTNDTNSEKLNDSWLEFFSKDSTELNVDEMLIKKEDVKKEAMDCENLEDNSSLVLKDKIKIEPDTQKSILYDQLTKESNVEVKIEPTDELPKEILKDPECFKKRIMKYMDPTTKKIYYLEMDRELDLSKVQEIVINSQGNVKKAKISPIKSNGLKYVRKNKNNLTSDTVKDSVNFSHIENDHCYVKSSHSVKEMQIEHVSVESDRNLYDEVCAAVLRFPCIRMAVSYLLKKIPLITVKAKDPEFVKYFPFVVESEDKYWKLDFAKRRNIEVRFISSLFYYVLKVCLIYNLNFLLTTDV